MRSDPIEITVTLKDIAGGVREDCAYCPIALAVKRAFPLASEVTVDYNDLSFYHGSQIFSADVPQHVADWMDSFDHARGVQPVSFPLVFEISEREETE